MRSSLEFASEKWPTEVRADKPWNEVQSEAEIAQAPDPAAPLVGEVHAVGVGIEQWQACVDT